MPKIPVPWIGESRWKKQMQTRGDRESCSTALGGKS